MVESNPLSIDIKYKEVAKSTNSALQVERDNQSDKFVAGNSEFLEFEHNSYHEQVPVL